MPASPNELFFAGFWKIIYEGANDNTRNFRGKKIYFSDSLIKSEDKFSFRG